MSAPRQIEIQGSVSAGFEAVREAFEENFARRHELGGACCVFHRGKKVVDLWGGVRHQASQAPWEEHTMVLVYSATKGLSAMTLALAHSRGWLDYEAPVCRYWPQFAQQGKDRITVRRCWRTRPGCSPSTSRWTSASSPTSTAWPSCWRARSWPESPAHGRPTMPSAWASTRVS